MHGITTSIRLPPQLREELEKAAHTLHRGKNWIVTEALQEYLAKLHHHELAKEARRQSILASRKKRKEDKSWEDNSDTSEWI